MQAHAEYLWELGKRLHAQNKIFLANGVHPDRVMLGFACDVMGGEGVPAYDSGENFYALRVAAGSKPYCLLNASHRVAPRLWNSCLYMGYLMGCNAEKGFDDEAKFLPVIIKLNEAGWEPVTCARAAPAVVGVERWGGSTRGAPLFFTVMNRSNNSVDAELTIDLGALDRPADVSATTLPSKLPIQIQREGSTLRVRLKLAPEEAAAIRTEPGSSTRL